MEKQKPTSKDFCFQSSDLTLSEKDGKRKFSGVGYSGHAIENHPYWGRVIFDMSTTEQPEKLPILLEHDRSKRIGFSSNIDIDNQINVDGEMLSNDYAKSVISDGDDGFPWQMSVHISPDNVEEIPNDVSTIVNGNEFSGGYVFRNNKIREISFTPTGWDDRTSANIFNNNGVQSMADPKHEAAIAALTQENTDLKASNEALKTEVSEFKESIKSIQLSQRTDQVKTLFSDIGREYSEDAVKPYIAMDDEMFSAIAKDMRESKPEPNKDFFSETATGEKGDSNKFSLSGQMKTMNGAK